MRNNKWLLVALIGSIAVNLALLGFVVGRASNSGLRPATLDPMHGFARLLRELPAERRDELRPHLREQFSAMHSSARGIRSAQREVRRAIVADPYDPDRLAQALDDVRDHLLASQATSNHAFLGLVNNLSLAERQQLALALSGSGPGGPRDHHFRPGHPPPGEPPTP